MTKDEFVESILKSAQVPLPGGAALAVEARSVRTALHDALAQVLPKEMILGGIELDRLQYANDAWQGKVEFALVLENRVVHVVGTLKEGSRRTLALSHTFIPLTSLSNVAVVTNFEEQASQVYMRSVDVVVDFETAPPLKLTARLPDNDPKHVIQFAQALLAASA